MLGGRRTVAVSGLALVLALSVGGFARADGDPASDVLFASDVYVPYPPPAKTSSTALRRTVAAAWARGYRLKVAVIASRADLGSVPERFGKPQQYATFLGTELRLFYVGPLLVVMPGGFGVYDGGRPTDAEALVLRRLSPPTAGATSLTEAAAGAVRALTSTRALRSKDILPPRVYAFPAAGRRGAPARLTYAITDDSKRGRVTITILRATRLVASLRTPLKKTSATGNFHVVWPVPSTATRFCVVGTDPTGNRSARACAPLTIR